MCRPTSASTPWASNIGVLGFLVDMLSYQPELAKTLFVFDNDKKELRAVVPSTQRTAPPTLQQDVEHAAQQLKDDIAQGLPPEQAQQRLAQLRAEAALAGVPDLPAQMLSVPSEGVSELPSEPHTPQEIDAVPAQEASATPAEPTVTPESAPEPAQEATPPAEPEDDAEDELIDIFLEEAPGGHRKRSRTTAAAARQPRRRRRAQPCLRRAFSHPQRQLAHGWPARLWRSRLGARTGVQPPNRRSAPGPPPLLNLAAHALTELGEWTAAIQQGQAEAFSSEPLRRAAEAYAAGESAEPALPTLHEAPRELNGRRTRRR